MNSEEELKKQFIKSLESLDLSPALSSIPIVYVENEGYSASDLLKILKEPGSNKIKTIIETGIKELEAILK